MSADGQRGRRVSDTPARRIVFAQYGDYGEAAERFAAGLKESYYAQKYSVEHVARLHRDFGPVTVICLNADSYDKVLPTGVRAIGMRLWEKGGHRRIRELLTGLEPTHAIVVAPLTGLLRWAAKRGIRTLPLFADSFPPGGFRNYFRYRRLSRTLNTTAFQWVANHNVNSSRDLARIGVDPAKIIPWDWPSLVTPDDYAPKSPPDSESPFRAIYVGHLSKAKGLQECVEAVARLKGTPEETSLTIIGGKPASQEFPELARSLGVLDKITFIEERVPHKDVVSMMHKHDAVLVPSRREYPEGLPMTIYDAFCARTPLIASDHPMFSGKVNNEENALVFRAGSASSLAEALQRLQRDSRLYASLSAGAKQAWEALQCPVKWGDLLVSWLRDSEEDRAWLAANSLAQGNYC